MTVDNVCCVQESAFSTMTQDEAAKKLKLLLCRFTTAHKPALPTEGRTHAQQGRKTPRWQEKTSRCSTANTLDRLVHSKTFYDDFLIITSTALSVKGTVHPEMKIQFLSAHPHA